jgi:hypothetical protein
MQATRSLIHSTKQSKTRKSIPRVGAVVNRTSVRPLTIEEIEATAQGFNDDLQRETNRKIRRHDSAGRTGKSRSNRIR